MNHRWGLVGFLILLGAAWGATQPMTKIAVSEGYRHFGLIFWQFVIGALLLALINMLRRRPLPLGVPQLRLYLIIALVGTILPNAASYEAARFLPSGIMSIVISTVPMFVFPIALLMGTDHVSWQRFAGLFVGFVGVGLLVVPEASLPDKAMTAYIPLALSAAVFYGLEGNIVAKWGTYGCGGIQVLLGASIVGALLTGPLAVLTGTWIPPHTSLTLPDFALILSSAIHAFAYAGYVWLVGRAGSVFAAQVSYLVTAFGMFWAMLVLSESYSNWVWLALGVIFAGLFLVQPKATTALAGSTPLPHDAVPKPEHGST
jgi:drug/metabolite transporter (DMT)-like permease